MPNTSQDSLATTLRTLPDAHLEAVNHALDKVLSTEVAEITYAQILDGLPLADVERDHWAWSSICPSNPLQEKHQVLCPGVLEHLRYLRQEFDPEQFLTFSPKVCLQYPISSIPELLFLTLLFQLMHDYRVAAPGSRAFKTRLIEMIAVAVHKVAAWIWNQNLSLHKNDDMAMHVPPEEESVPWPSFPVPTYFVHQWYCDYDQYPDGVADGVGYWAESRILGGVVLFDRRDAQVNGQNINRRVKTFPANLGLQSDMVYFHTDRHDVTYRIYALLDRQKQQLVDFLLGAQGNSPDMISPLPILGDKENRTRVDPEEHIRETGIYRDIWERKELPLSTSPSDFRLKDVFDGFDWVTYEEWQVSRRRARHRLELAYRKRSGTPSEDGAEENKRGYCE